MIIVRVSAEGDTDQELTSLIDHLEMQAGLWGMLHRKVVQVQSMTFDGPPASTAPTLDGMVLG